VQIETAMRNFNLEMSGPIDPKTAVQVGAWLGADAVVLGSFLRFGDVYRIDARMIDAETGEVLAADSESGAENAVMGMVDDLGAALVARFQDGFQPTPVARAVWRCNSV
jgi:TolB-like protein